MGYNLLKNLSPSNFPSWEILRVICGSAQMYLIEYWILWCPFIKSLLHVYLQDMGHNNWLQWYSSSQTATLGQNLFVFILPYFYLLFPQWTYQLPVDCLLFFLYPALLSLWEKQNPTVTRNDNWQLFCLSRLHTETNGGGAGWWELWSGGAERGE